MSDLPVPREEGVSVEPEAPQSPDPRLMERFLQVQAQELEFRKQELETRREELELRKQESGQAYEFAKDSLKVQEGDLKEYRQQEKRESWQVVIIVISVLLVVAAVLVYALHRDKDQFVLELFRLVLSALGGGGLGYGLGRRKGSKTEPTATETE
jgi:Trk-type K+ transport system membrane component